MKVLVLGHKGMLGHMVAKYLKDKSIHVETINQRFPFKKLDFKGEYIVNCIGAIPQKTNNFNINWKLPFWLDHNMKHCRIIHPGTDCEMDNDDYGLSKAKAAKYLVENSKRTKILKTSIIGPELKGSASLLEWFLSQENEVFGYTKAMWNGNTTLEWAKQCFHLMTNWDSNHNEMIISSTPVSKFELLNAIKVVFNKDIAIIEQDKGSNKCLEGIIYTGTIQEQLEELKEYYYDN